LYVCHLWHKKDTASVNSTSVDACSIHSLTNATGINRGRVNTVCVFLVSQMTHIQSLTNATGINRGRLTLTVSFSCHRWLYVCLLWHEKDTTSVNSTSVDACCIGKWWYVCHLWQEKDTASVNSTCVDAYTGSSLSRVTDDTHTITYQCYRHQQR
jgi:hypothetical protein